MDHCPVLMPQRRVMKTPDRISELLTVARQHGLEAHGAMAARDRTIVEARTLGASYRQIATALGITKAGAQSLVRRAMDSGGNR